MFRCEVSVEKSFYTLSSSKNVTVVGKDSWNLNQQTCKQCLMRISSFNFFGALPSKLLLLEH